MAHGLIPQAKHSNQPLVTKSIIIQRAQEASISIIHYQRRKYIHLHGERKDCQV